LLACFISASYQRVFSLRSAQLAKAFPYFLFTASDSDDAVDAWLLDNPELQPLFTNNAFIAPFLSAIAQRVNNTFGLRARVLIGACFSMGDTVSDSLVVIQYYKEGQNTSAVILLGLMIFGLIVQVSERR